MSEFINNSSQRKEMLRHLILQLHKGDNPEVLRRQLIERLRSIPYNEVVEVEQELINSKELREEEILHFCDLHTQALEGAIDQKEAKQVPPGHPVDTFKKENIALQAEIDRYNRLKTRLLSEALSHEDWAALFLDLHRIFNNLADVDKHYKRKEYLLFPYLEQKGITGPPKVMWGKHDEARALLKNAFEAINAGVSSQEELMGLVQLVFDPAIEQIGGMIFKEENILLPMALDTLSEAEWAKVYEETMDFGYCLIDPKEEWTPSEQTATQEAAHYIQSDAIRLSSGAFNLKELEALFVHLPIDITFVDKDDKVRFFSHSPKRVFERNRSIIGRDVRMCHPPGSVHIVEQIIDDFKSGREHKAAFWLSNFQGRFVYIEYSAVRSPEGEYLGVVEVTQDLTELRKLEGDQRLLSYTKK